MTRHSNSADSDLPVLPDVAELEKSSSGVETKFLRAKLRSDLFNRPLPESLRVGRFVILERVGAGGMGTVFRAYDPDLDRSVAVKVLHEARLAATRPQILAREARALARLTHPNVVVVHDVVTAEEHTFIAMEYVDGENLREWSQSHPDHDRRRFDEALRLLLEAGEGLAAAHAAGLIHRDFKPANVLIGSDGRARVADFGLAHYHAPEETEGAGTDEDGVAGTPAFMAPEQRRGEAVDARSDQYSYCVAAWEVLFGQRPEARPRLPSSRDVRRQSVARALIRGLATDPATRHASMRGLLDALARNPRQRRRRLLGGAGLGAVAIACVLGYRAYDATACDDAAAAVAELWNPERARALEAASTTVELPASVQTWPSTKSAVDRQAAGLSEAYTEVCRSGREAGRGREVEFATRRQCVDNTTLELASALDVLETPTLDVVLGAPRMIGRAVARPCVEWTLERLEAAGRLRMPGPDHRALVRATLIARVGQHHDAEQALRELSASAFADDPIRRSAALAALGYTLREVGRLDEALETQERAYWLALRNGADDIAFRAAHSLTIALVQRDLDQAEHWARAMEAALQRAELGVPSQAGLLYARREIAMRAGDLERAEALAREDVALSTEHWGPDHLETASAYSGLATVLQQRRAFDEAVTLARRVLQVRVDAYGDVHPRVAHAYGTLAVSLGQAGRYAEAAGFSRKAAELYGEVYGAGHIQRGRELSNVGVTLVALGDPVGALVSLREAAEIYDEQLKPDDALVISIRINIATAEASLGACQQALATIEEAGEQLRRKTPKHPRNGLVAEVRASCQSRLGPWDRAHASFESAFEFYEVIPKTRAQLLIKWARALRRHGEHDLALAKVEQAKALVAASDDPELIHIEAELERARSLQARGEHEEAATAMTAATTAARDRVDEPLALARLLSEQLGHALAAPNRPADGSTARAVADEIRALLARGTDEHGLARLRLAEIHLRLAEAYAAHDAERTRDHAAKARKLFEKADASYAAERDRLDALER